MGDCFYCKTVTVWNKCISDDVMGGETWLPTVLENVRLLETHGANVVASGMSAADSAKLFIKGNNLGKYKTPKEWSALKDDDKPIYYTLTQGQDFFVEGDKSDIIPTDDDFFSNMKKNYDGVYKITNVDKYDLIPHLEVGGE